MARLRHDLPTTLVAERAGISMATLWRSESGLPADVTLIDKIKKNI